MKREHLKPRVYHSISEMQRTFGLPQPLHPLISLLDFNKVRITAEMLAETFSMDFYNITYNESAGCRKVLTVSDLTVGKIAYQLGFEHPQSFNKLFKSKTNFSPWNSGRALTEVPSIVKVWRYLPPILSHLHSVRART
nr:AraC family transcriptional regulator [Dyadobacter sp. CY351]